MSETDRKRLSPLRGKKRKTTKSVEPKAEDSDAEDSETETLKPRKSKKVGGVRAKKEVADKEDEKLEKAQTKNRITKRRSASVRTAKQASATPSEVIVLSD